MSRDKQIEEMALTEVDILANDLNQHCADLAENYCGGTTCLSCLANALTAKGYRKASDVAREIFAEIDNLLYQDERDYDDLMDSETVAEIYQEYLACSNYICGVRKAIAKLKKKYTESEKDE